jgi:heme-degrading monooxygenase HmoA
MMRVIYRWKVKPGREEAFAEAWNKMTRAIRTKVPGSRGSMLVRSRSDPSEFLGIARWESFNAWASARSGARLPIDLDAGKAMEEAAGASISTEFYDEVYDLTDAS